MDMLLFYCLESGQYCICRLISPLETVSSAFSHHRCVWIWWITTPRRPEEKQGLVHLASTGLDPPFVFRTALILRGIDSTRCWKHSSEILVHIDMISSHSCCRFVCCTSMMWISSFTTSQSCSIGLRSGASFIKFIKTSTPLSSS